MGVALPGKHQSEVEACQERDVQLGHMPQQLLSLLAVAGYEAHSPQ